MKTKGLNNVANATSAVNAGPTMGTIQDIKVLSLDAETNGLWGTAFQIAAVLYDHGTIITFNGQCPIEGDINPWVKENVMPYVDGVMYDSYYLLLKDFMEWYKSHKDGADVIVHVGLPVEARLFIDAHNYGFLGDWDAPFPLIDISALPEIGTSVDSYNKEHNIEVPYKGDVHNALYDSWAALMAYCASKGKALVFYPVTNEDPFDYYRRTKRCPICGSTNVQVVGAISLSLCNICCKNCGKQINHIDW